MTPKIGVLALQGAFIEHAKIFSDLNCRVTEIRTTEDLNAPFHALILPGGESTAQSKMLHELGLFKKLKKKIDAGLPVMATCAGLILLAEKLENSPVTHFGSLPVTVRRNAYGRQLGSFYISGTFDGIPEEVPMPFIRAPQIIEAGKEVKILSTFNGLPTAVSYRNILALCFHPEITGNHRIHEFFLSKTVLPAFSG